MPSKHDVQYLHNLEVTLSRLAMMNCRYCKGSLPRFLLRRPDGSQDPDFTEADVRCKPCDKMWRQFLRRNGMGGGHKDYGNMRRAYARWETSGRKRPYWSPVFA